MFLQGLETLPLRMERHCSNGLAVAEFLSDHDCVEWVRYPGLPGDPMEELNNKYVGRPPKNKIPPVFKNNPLEAILEAYTLGCTFRVGRQQPPSVSC